MATRFDVVWQGASCAMDFVHLEVLVVLCKILIVHSVSVNVDQLMGMFDIHHKMRLQKALVHSVKVEEDNELNG
jgi:hypothetical protein